MNREEAFKYFNDLYQYVTTKDGIEAYQIALSVLCVPQPDPITGRGQAGDNHWCSHCWDFAQTGVKYVVAVEDNRGMQYPTKKNIPYNYCPSCGRKLEG